MSLVRNSSKKKFSLSPDDLASCLDQKNSMIAVLQAQVEDLRYNQEKYERMQEQVCRTKQRYQNCLRDYQINKVSNQERLQLTAKNCLQLKIQVDHLDKEFQIKNQQLKDAKCQSQQLVQHSSRRQDDVAEIQIKGEQLKTTNELLRMEEDRSKTQLILAREELQRQRRQNSNISKSLQNVKDKCHKTQSYIRSLVREEATINQNLTKIQDQNNFLDNHISELNTVQALTSAQLSNVQKEIQQNKFQIASKELELKRTQKQIKQTSKNLGLEKDKMKALGEQNQQRKFSLTRMESQVRECSEEINYILAKNNEVTDVNTQLRNDLKVCERHLENVLRVNKNMDVQLNKFKELNWTAIRKLQQPMKDVSNSQMNKVSTGKLTNTSRMTATGGFECNNSN